jgi:hypothetical protein
MLSEVTNIHHLLSFTNHTVMVLSLHRSDSSARSRRCSFARASASTLSRSSRSAFLRRRRPLQQQIYTNKAITMSPTVPHTAPMITFAIPCFLISLWDPSHLIARWLYVLVRRLFCGRALHGVVRALCDRLCLWVLTQSGTVFCRRGVLA